MSESRKNRRWIWYFVVLAVLAVLAVAINWVWNAGEPLTPEKLQEARTLWQRSRPANYDLKITIARNNARQVDKLDVRLRGGDVVEFLINGREPDPLLDRDGNRNLLEERARRESYDIVGLFDSIEELMEQDRRANRSTFTRARFDKADGHVTSFTRQFQGLREQYFKVEMTRPAP